MCNNEVAKFLHKFKRTLKTNNLFMNIFKFYYLLIGLFIVLASILFEAFREPTNFVKGFFSINVGLIVLFLSIKNRENIEPGLQVDIVQKHHQHSGELTRGVVANILTKSQDHPHGIKVRLETGEVGRVQNII